jgi:hypothetical protein
MFCSKNRAAVMTAHPGLPPTDVTRKLGEQWRGLSEAAKKPYVAQSAQDKSRYHIEMESYAPPPVDDEPSSTTPNKKKQRRKRDPNLPKGASSAYILFSSSRQKSVREENPGMSVPDVGRALGGEWRAMTPKTKKPWQKKALKDRERAASEKAAYIALN